MRWRVSVLCGVAVLMALVTPVWAAVEHPRNVILIGWDGAQREHVDQCLGRNELPNLKRLIDEGKYIKIDAEGTTDTKAGWSQILTGYNPEITGVYSNSNYQPVPKGLSIFERLEKQFGTNEFVTVAVIGKKKHCGEIDPPTKIRLDEEGKQNSAGAADANDNGGEEQAATAKKLQGKIVEENGVKYRVTPGSPYYGMHTALEAWEFGLITDEKVGSRAIQLLEKYKDKPFFFFVHFAHVDAAGHKNGENSQEYNDALISADLWTGKIMDKVKALGLADQTQFYVTADHGFNEGAKGHPSAPYTFLATNNKAVSRDGRRQDIAPTIYEAFGVNVAAMQPPLNGISLTQPDNRPAAKLNLPKVVKAAAKKPEEVTKRPDVVYVPTPQPVVDKMLELAKVTKDDLVYDLGCGDGRIVVTAAKKYGCKAFGFDVDPRRIKESTENVEKNGVSDLVTIEQKDIFTLDLSDVNVVTLYLLPSLNVKLIPQLEKLKPGSRIVSHDFDMRGVKPDQVVEITTDNGISHTIYLWTTPLKKEP